MSYEEIFNRLKKTFSKTDVSKVKEHYAFQFNIRSEEHTSELQSL